MTWRQSGVSPWRAVGGSAGRLRGSGSVQATTPLRQPPRPRQPPPRRAPSTSRAGRDRRDRGRERADQDRPYLRRAGWLPGGRRGQPAPARHGPGRVHRRLAARLRRHPGRPPHGGRVRQRRGRPDRRPGLAAHHHRHGQPGQRPDLGAPAGPPRGPRLVDGRHDRPGSGRAPPGPGIQAHPGRHPGRDRDRASRFPPRPPRRWSARTRPRSCRCCSPRARPPRPGPTSWVSCATRASTRPRAPSSPNRRSRSGSGSRGATPPDVGWRGQDPHAGGRRDRGCARSGRQHRATRLARPGRRLLLYPGAGHAFLFQDTSRFLVAGEQFLG